MANTLVCNYNNSGENVMVFAETLGVVTVAKALTALGKYFDDVYEVGNSELQYYLFEPLFCDAELEDNFHRHAAKCDEYAWRRCAERIGYARR